MKNDDMIKKMMIYLKNQGLVLLTHYAEIIHSAILILLFYFRISSDIRSSLDIFPIFGKMDLERSINFPIIVQDLSHVNANAAGGHLTKSVTNVYRLAAITSKVRHTFF